MNSKTRIWVIVALVLGVVGSLSGVSAWLKPAQALPGFSPQGVTHFTDLSLSGDLTVADDSVLTDDVDVGGDINIGSENNYPIEHGAASAGYEIYFNVTEAFTGTSTVLSTTSGIGTVVAVVCGIDDPDDDAGDSFICKASHSDGDVTITAEQDDGDTATEADTTAFYIIAGY